MNTRIAVKENFDDDDLSDDVDDEVFVRDGTKSILKTEKHQKGDERPLMPPRRKSKQRQRTSNPDVCNRQPCNIYNCLLPVYFAIATIISIAFLMLLYIFLVDKLPLLVNRFGIWSSSRIYQQNIIAEPCLDVKLNNIWTQTIPKITSDSQIKLLDVNKDNVEDVIIGIGTELDDIHDGDRLCDEFYDNTNGSCSGGVVAIDGKTGGILWHHWLRRLVLSVHCEFEITGDFVNDCLATGKGGLMVAISGADGAIIWELVKPKREYYIDLYNVLLIHDLDSDNHMDVLATHTSGNDVLQSHLLVMSGRKGKPLQRLAIPSHEPILHAPQILTDIDGNDVVLFITGDLSHSGGIYIIPISDLLKGDQNGIRNIHHHKTGILAAPVLVDMNLDGLQDIVYIADNNVYALDGATYNAIWNVSLYDYVSSAFQITVASSVTPAYFDSDWIPDLMVSFAVGSGYPEYYFSMTLILNGKTGASILSQPIVRSSVPDTVGAITLSNAGPGHDAFIYWTAACQNRESSKDPFTFMPQESRAFWSDLCALRFNSTLNMELYALSQHLDAPGTLLYSAKSHMVDVTDNLNYNVIENSMEMSQRLPIHYKLMNPRGKPIPNSMLQQLQSMESDNSAETDGKTYATGNDNSWDAPKTKYQGNLPLDYDHNENNGDPSSDYELENDAMNARNEKEYGNLRYRRSIPRPAVNKMIPKVSASGVIAKSFDGTNLDLIVAHYEVKAHPDVQIVIDKNEECIQNCLALSSISSSKYYGLPPDKLKQQVFKDCLMYTAPLKYANIPKNKLLSLQMENLYITRNRITCNCEYIHDNEKSCNSILPYEKQSYPMYLGRYGNSVYKTRVPFD